MAWAKSSRLPLLRFSFNRGMPDLNRSMGRGAPITPVEETITRSSEILNSAATKFAVSFASKRPWAPVKQLALPELTNTAWHIPF